jgi:hypothetical protein
MDSRHTPFTNVGKGHFGSFAGNRADGPLPAISRASEEKGSQERVRER